MSQRELLIVLAHALSCSSCRSRLLAAPNEVLRGHALTESERASITKLGESDFMTSETLARKVGALPSDLQAYGDHAVVRLRHF